MHIGNPEEESHSAPSGLPSPSLTAGRGFSPEIMLRAILTASVFMASAVVMLALFFDWLSIVPVALATSVISLLGLRAIQRVTPVVAVVPIMVTCAAGVLYAAYRSHGINSVALTLIPLLIVAAVVFSNRVILISFTVLVVLSAVGMVSLRLWVRQEDFFGPNIVGDLTVFGLICSLAAVLSHIVSMRLHESIGRVKESETRYRGIFENLQDAYFEMRPDGTLIEVNPAGLALFGRSREDLIGKPFLAAHAGEPAQEALLGALAGEKHIANHPMVLRNSQGAFRHVLISASIEEGPGHGPRVIGSIRDVTERRVLEENLAQARKMDSIGLLAGGIAHDFNNYLTVINGYVELALARAPNLDPPVQARLLEIRKAGQRAAELTSQLLAFSRKHVSEPRAVDLNALVEDVSAMLSRIIGDDVHLHLSLGQNLGFVVADVSQLSHCLVNLAANSRDAMPNGGEVGIRTSLVQLSQADCRARPEAIPGEFIQISFTDTGIGMNEETKRRVFEPFFTTKDVGRGTGLGLSTVYGIVKQTGGWVEVSSQIGKGTEVQLFLPRTLLPVEEEVAVSAGESAAAGHGTILLVEDNADVRRLAAQVLSEAGYDVLEASDGVEATTLAAAFAGPIDLLITDMVMSRVSGRELARKLTADRPQMKALIVSGYAGELSGLTRQPPAGARFLAKPFTPTTLLSKVRECLA